MRLPTRGVNCLDWLELALALELHAASICRTIRERRLPPEPISVSIVYGPSRVPEVRSMW